MTHRGRYCVQPLEPACVSDRGTNFECLVCFKSLQHHLRLRHMCRAHWRQVWLQVVRAGVTVFWRTGLVPSRLGEARLQVIGGCPACLWLFVCAVHVCPTHICPNHICPLVSFCCPAPWHWQQGLQHNTLELTWRAVHLFSLIWSVFVFCQVEDCSLVVLSDLISVCFLSGGGLFTCFSVRPDQCLCLVGRRTLCCSVQPDQRLCLVGRRTVCCSVQAVGTYYFCQHCFLWSLVIVFKKKISMSVSCVRVALKMQGYRAGASRTPVQLVFCWMHHLMQVWVNCVVQKHPSALCDKGRNTLQTARAPKLSQLLSVASVGLAGRLYVCWTVCLSVGLSVCFSVSLHQCVSSLPLILKWMVSCLDGH